MIDRDSGHDCLGIRSWFNLVWNDYLSEWKSWLIRIKDSIHPEWNHDWSGIKSWLIWIEVMIDRDSGHDKSGFRSWLIGIQVMIDLELGHDLIWFEVIYYSNGSHDWSGLKIRFIRFEVLLHPEWSHDWSGIRSWFNLVWSDYLSEWKSWLIRILKFDSSGLKFCFIRNEVIIDPNWIQDWSGL